MGGGPSDDEAFEGPHERAEPPMPLWVKAGIVVFVVVLLAIVILAVTGVHEPPAGGHGP